MHRMLLFMTIVVSAGCDDRPLDNRTRAPASSSETFHNPVDGKTYVAPGGWQTYKPDVPRPEDPNRKVKTERIRLLTAQDVMATRTTVEALAAFIREAERLADESFSTSGKRFKLLAQFKCTPLKHEVELTHQGDATRELLQKYYDALATAKKLPVESGDVSFQIEFSISP